ncbi:hypothetical protein BY458DRAFT_510983 [Sporodiniella umbellata]|nr:hypothetical protein BY458DRAFT_510983 [Sporodiniella umbellata]
MRTFFFFLFLVFALTYVLAENFTKYIVTLEPSATLRDIEQVKQDIVNSGGIILQEISIIDALIVSFPTEELGSLSTLEYNRYIKDIIEDQEVQAFS